MERKNKNYSIEFNYFTIFIISCLAVSNAQSRETQAIINGNLAKEGEIPYIVSISKNDDHKCGGGIIDEQFILTAAHCFVGESNGFRTGVYRISAGITNMYYDPNSIDVDIEKIYIPKHYDGSTDEELSLDIAVVKLKEKLYLGDGSKLQKLLLPRVKDTFEGKNATISGFGYTSLDLHIKSTEEDPREVGESDGKLYTSDVKILNTDDCKAKSYPSIGSTHICGRMIKGKKERFYGVCSGDSGGPLVYNSQVIIGVLSSSGYGCDESQDPGLYTRVSSFVQFIKDAKADKDSDMRTYRGMTPNE